MNKTILALLLCASLSANADTTNLGSIPTWGSYLDKHSITTSFEDVYKFSTYSSLMSFSIESSGISGLKVSLNGKEFETDKTGSTLYWDSEKVSNIVKLDSDEYELKVEGSTHSGDYWGHINVSPVPEPEQWLLLLVGLGIITRKYKNGDAS